MKKTYRYFTAIQPQYGGVHRLAFSLAGKGLALAEYVCYQHITLVILQMKNVNTSVFPRA